MISSKLFQKHFLLAILTLIVFIVFGVYFNHFLVKTLTDRPTTAEQQSNQIPPLFIARIIDRLNPNDKLKSITELTQWQGDMRGPTLVLFNDKGDILFPQYTDVKLDWNEIKKPTTVYDYVVVKDDRSHLFPREAFHIVPSPMTGMDMGGRGGPPPPPPDGPGGRDGFSPPPMDGPGFRGGPGGMGGPRMNMESVLIRLSGEPAQYLYMGPPKMIGPPPGMNGPNGLERPNKWFPFFGLISLVISLFLGVGAAISLIYYSVNKNVKQADLVISELQKGNLKARFPVTRKDEFGRAMLRFNKMAEEIEKLVEQLKLVEVARTKLLQELAHDLRTPIASLKSLLEVLAFKKQHITPEVQVELTSLSLREVDYFERLVEDLLFLAQVSEPKYNNKYETVELNDIFKDEIDDCIIRGKSNLKPVKVSQQELTEDIQIDGDPLLLRRLFRNALENAYSFAKSSVAVSIQKQGDGKIRIIFEDDGPGFSNEAIKAYGERRLSRKIEKDNNGRLSVGLGSVVMKTICLVHNGHIEVSNRIGTDGKIAGARVEITLQG